MPATFTIHEVAGGVWAAVAPGTSGPAVSNAAIVDLGDKTLVVDTFMTVRAAGELADEVLRLTGRKPFLVVNSHWHSDHVRGNQVFAGLPIVGTQRMRELIIEDSPKTPQEFQDRVAAVQQAADVAASAAETPEEQQQAAGMQALAAALTAQSGSYQMVLPDLLIGDRLTIEGARSATILTYGRGHTESDLFVYLPDDDLVVAGDLVWTGTHPKTNDGFPAEWAAVLEKIADELRPSSVVSGHGPPGTAADITAMAKYLRGVDQLLEAARVGDLDLQGAVPPPGSEDWDGLSRFHAGLAKLAPLG